MFFIGASALMFIIAFVVIHFLVVPLQIPLGFKVLFSLLILLISQKMVIFSMFFRSEGFYRLPAWFMIVTGFLQIWLIILFLLMMAGIVIGLVLLLFNIEIPYLMGILFVISLIISADGIWNTFKVPPVKEITVSVPQAPADFEPLKMVQLSDLHIGSGFSKAWLQQVVDKTNALKPDVILITGDTIDGYPKELLPQLEPLKQLKAPLGVYMVLGNHEYYFGAKAWTEAFEQMGIPVLVNQSVILRDDDQAVALGGVPALEAKPDVRATFNGIGDRVPRVLMAHFPASAPIFANERVDLQVSGHTHGGQMFWPFNRLVGMFNNGFIKGLYPIGDMVLYVSAGTGLWGGFPVRLMTPSEITLITLKR